MEELVKILATEYLGGNKLLIRFSDKTEKVIDFALLFPDSPMTNELRPPNVFQQVKIYEHGRGIYWPNGYDVDPEFLRFYT